MATTNEWLSQYHVRNDSPVWLKPRRTVYFITNGWAGPAVTTPTGRYRTWRTREAAGKACDRLNRIRSSAS